MTDISLEHIAEQLRLAEYTRTTCPPIRAALTDTGLSIEESAYKVQYINTTFRIAQGERLTGRKIGLTSKAVQTQLGVNSPDYGALFNTMAVGSGESIRLTDLIQPKIEGEIALVLGQDLTQRNHTYADIIQATAFALAAIEIVDSRIDNWQISLADTVADNGSSARYILGSRPVSLHNVDLEGCAMSITNNQATLSQGQGKLCMGNPLNAMIWLADTMVAQGTPLLAGHTILTGALGPMVTVSTPANFSCQITGFDPIQVIFE